MLEFWIIWFVCGLITMGVAVRDDRIYKQPPSIVFYILMLLFGIVSFLAFLVYMIRNRFR